MWLVELFLPFQISSMEQRASALQQRLEARRNMFLKNDASGASTYGTKTTTSAASGKTFVISHRKISILKHTGLKKSKKSSSLILYFRTKIHTSDQCEEVSGSSAIFFYGFLIPIWKKSPITNSFFVEIGTWFDNSFQARQVVKIFSIKGRLTWKTHFLPKHT